MTVTAEGKSQKNASAEDLRSMKDRVFSNTDVVGGVDLGTDYTALMVRMSNASGPSQSSSGIEGPSFASDVLRTGSVQTLIASKTEDKKPGTSKSEEKSRPKDAPGSDQSGDDMEEGAAGTPEDRADKDSPERDSEPSSTKKAFFDRDRQIASAKRQASASLQSFRAQIERTAKSVQTLVQSFDQAESSAFASELKLLKTRASFLTDIFVGPEAVETYRAQFQYKVGSAKGGGLAPPVRNMHELRPWTDLTSAVDDMENCETKEDLAKASKQLGNMRRPIAALVANISSTVVEIQHSKGKAPEEQR